MAEGIAEVTDVEALKRELHAYVWQPVYLPYERLKD
jgi:hypothetical protein